MPTYEYECQRCGRFDHWQSITAPSLLECPKCGGPVKKLISGNVGVIFKGSGFHVTDYRSKEYSERAKQEADSGSKEEPSETGASGKSGA